MNVVGKENNQTNTLTTYDSFIFGQMTIIDITITKINRMTITPNKMLVVDETPERYKQNAGIKMVLVLPCPQMLTVPFDKVISFTSPDIN